MTLCSKRRVWPMHKLRKPVQLVMAVSLVTPFCTRHKEQSLCFIQTGCAVSLGYVQVNSLEKLLKV